MLVHPGVIAYFIYLKVPQLGCVFFSHISRFDISAYTPEQFKAIENYGSYWIGSDWMFEQTMCLGMNCRRWDACLGTCNIRFLAVYFHYPVHFTAAGDRVSYYFTWPDPPWQLHIYILPVAPAWRPGYAFSFYLDICWDVSHGWCRAGLCAWS